MLIWAGHLQNISLRLHMCSDCYTECIIERKLIHLQMQYNITGSSFLSELLFSLQTAHEIQRSIHVNYPEDECCLFLNDRKTQWSCILLEKAACNCGERETFRLLQKSLCGGRRGVALESHKTNSGRAFATWLIGVLPGNWGPFPWCWLISQHCAIGSNIQYNLGGDLEEALLSMGCVWGQNDRVVCDYYSLLLQPCRPECVIALDQATAAESLSVTAMPTSVIVIVRLVLERPACYPGSGWEK